MLIKSSPPYIAIILLFCLGCSSPQKLYEKGKYFKAFDSAFSDLKSGKKDRDNKILLNKAFSKMIDVAREQMVYLENGYQIRDLQDNFEQYEEVDKRYVKARAYIDEDNRTKYDIFYQEEVRLIANTYEEGKALMDFFEESKNKLDAQNAYLHFELVSKYSRDYPDIQKWLDESIEAAIVVYNVYADLDSDFSYQWDVDRKFNDLEGEDGFLQIVYDDNSVEADCKVELDFSRLDIDERKNQSSQNFSKEIIDGYKTETDTSGNSVQVPIYKEVYGSVNTVSLIKSISWSVEIEVLKSTINCNLDETRYRAIVDDQVEIYELEGDERAIPSEYKNQSVEELEDTDDLVDELIEKLYDSIKKHFY